MRCIDKRHFETQSVCFRQYSSSFIIVSFVFNCWHKVARLWLERRLLDGNQWHVKRSLSMYKEHSISAAYRPLYHFHIGSRPPYNRTLIMAPCKPLTMMAFGTMLNLVIAPLGLDSALILWDQAAWRKARNVFVLLSAGLATNQASTETPDMCRGKRDTDKRVRCIYECS